MKSYFIEKNITFSDSYLAPGWIKKNFEVKEEAIVSFIGTYKSKKLKAEREATNLPIPFQFENMLHFVVEHEKVKKNEMEVRKRLFLSMLCDLLGEEFVRKESKIFYGPEQLNISQSTANTKAAIFHVALFIFTEAEEIPLIGLDYFDVNPKELAYLAMRTYCDEIDSLEKK